MPTSRRTLLRVGFAAAATLTARSKTMAKQLEADPYEFPAAGGKLSHDPKVVAMAAEDFGHIIHQKPQAVLEPASAADIAELMHWASRRGVKVVARGQGHSTYGRAMVDGGIVVDMAGMRTIRSVEQDRVVVDAGATWNDVIKATLPHGLTPPVLTNYLDLSVGGTLAIGGIGGTTYRHGMQTDNVLELNVVTGDGRELTCSVNLNPALFDAARAGLGQCGIVTQATLRLMPAPERARRFHLLYEDLRSLSTDLRRVLADGRFDYLQGAVLPDCAVLPKPRRWKYQLEGVVFYNSDRLPDENAMLAGLADVRASAEITDLSYLEEISAFARLEQLLRTDGQWLNPHPWLLTFLPGSNAERIAGDILSELTPEDVGPFGRVAFYPIFTGALRTPLVRMPDENIAFIFNLVRIRHRTTGSAVRAVSSIR